jgi:hypothetical protein
MEKGRIGKRRLWRPTRPWKPIMVPLSIVLSMGYAFALYSFFQGFRETIRIMGTPFLSGIFVFLEPSEIFLYNLFFASISCVIGLSVGIKFLMENSSFRQPIKWKVRQRHIITEMRFMHWGFLFIFGKVLSVFAIFYMMFMFQYDINFLREFPIIFLCLPLVLFLQLWTQINLVLRKKGLIYMGVAFLAVAVFSVVLAGKKFPDYQGNDKVLQQVTIEKYFPAHPPESEHNTVAFIEGPAIISIQSKPDSSRPSITYLIKYKPVSQEKFISELVWFYEIYYMNRAGQIPIYADASTPYKTIKSIREKLSEKFPTSIYYYTKFPESKYPVFYTYPAFYGFVRSEPCVFPKLDTLLQEGYQLGSSKKLLIPESYLYRNRQVRGVNRVEVKISENMLFLNNQDVGEAELEDFIYQFISTYSPSYFIIFSPSPDITYGRYLQGLELLMRPLSRLRQEVAYQEFGEAAENLLRQHYHPDMRHVFEKYPDRVVEWTSQEMVIEHLIRTQRARLIR